MNQLDLLRQQGNYQLQQKWDTKDNRQTSLNPQIDVTQSIFPENNEDYQINDLLWREQPTLLDSLSNFQPSINNSSQVEAGPLIIRKFFLQSLDKFFDWVNNFFNGALEQNEPTNEELQEKLGEINGSIDEKKEILDRIYSGECESLNELKDVSDEKYENYKSALTELDPELAENIFGVEDKINNYDKQIDESNKKILENQDKITSLDEEIESLTAEKDEIQNQINELLFSSNGFKIKINQAELSTKIEELFDKKKEIEEQIAKKQEERKTAKSEINSAEQEIIKNNEQKKVAILTKKILEAQIPSDATDVLTAKDSYNTAKEEYTTAKNDSINTTKDELAKLEEEKANIEKQIETKGAEENDEIKDPSEMTQTEIKEKINELRKEQKDLESERNGILIAATIQIDTDRLNEIEFRLIEIENEIKNLEQLVQPEERIYKF